MRSIWLMRNKGDGTFEDVTERSKIIARRSGEAGGRAVDVHAFGDVDNDGDLDVYLGVSTVNPTANLGETSEIMLQNADHTFSHGSALNAVRLVGDVDTVAAASFVDFDLDGDIDLWTPHHGYAMATDFTFRAAHLYANDGQGNFTDVTAAVGLSTREWNSIADINAGLSHSRAWAGNACDLNNDGLPELLSASYGRAPNHLWKAARSQAGVSYSNLSVASGYAYDLNQTWQDDQFARCFCQTNRTAPGCATVPLSNLSSCSNNWSHDTGREPFRLGGNSGTTVCGDIDNDGDIDLLTTEIAHWWAGQGSDGAEVLINNGAPEVSFSRPGRASMGIEIPHDDASGWNEGIMTGAMFDFDADGKKDLFFGMSDYPGNHAVLLQQDGQLHFREVPRSMGIDQNRSHGIAVADFDENGSLDVVVGHSRARCGAPDDCYATTQIKYFRNQLPTNFIKLRLQGVTSNRSAIGARISVTSNGITQTSEVEGGHGQYGYQHDLVQFFGLGPACEATVKIRWPDSTLSTQTFQLKAGHRYHVKQGHMPVPY